MVDKSCSGAGYRCCIHPVPMLGMHSQRQCDGDKAYSVQVPTVPTSLLWLSFWSVLTWHTVPEKC